MTLHSPLDVEGGSGDIARVIHDRARTFDSRESRSTWMVPRTEAPVAETLPQERLHPQDTLLRCDSDLVGILVQGDRRRLVALRDIARGAHLFRLAGRECPAPTKYSVQVGATLHLDPDCVEDEQELVRRYFWRFLDHACEPTTRIRDREVIAVRDIAAGEGVTFHYCTTEYDMASPFACHCGSPRCLGVIRGARHLTPEQRRRLAGWLPDYLRTRPARANVT